ncbi:MAG TPA: O-antigen ligase family protein, partial [Ilumatobacteraceae bacterium]
ASVGTNRFPIDPATAVVLLFIGFSLTWVFAQFRAGTWHRCSMTTRALVVFAVIAAVGAPLAWDRTVAIVAVAKIVGSVMMFVVLEQLLTGRPDRARTVVIAVFASAIPPLAAGLWQMFMGVEVPVEPTLTGRIRGTFLHPNTFATYLAFVIALGFVLLPMLRGAARYAVLAIVGVGCVELIATGGRSAWAGLVVGLVIALRRVATRLLVAILIAVAVVLVAVPSVSGRIADLNAQNYENAPGNSFAWRVAYWERLLPLAQGEPVLGIGLDGARALPPGVIDRPDIFGGRPPHNVWVQAVVETGFAGLAALVAVAVCFAVDLRRRLRSAAPGLEHSLAAAAVAVAVVALVQSPVENLLIQPIVWWYLAACATYGLSSAVQPSPRVRRSLASAR